MESRKTSPSTSAVEVTMVARPARVVRATKATGLVRTIRAPEGSKTIRATEAAGAIGETKAARLAGATANHLAYARARSCDSEVDLVRKATDGDALLRGLTRDSCRIRACPGLASSG